MIAPINNIRLGGSFTKIGDSIRKYIAQVDKYGKPTAWNKPCNDVVKNIFKRNDTLFISGAFTNFGGFTRRRFAMYSFRDNQILINGSNSNFLDLLSINTFLASSCKLSFIFK